MLSALKASPKSAKNPDLVAYACGAMHALEAEFSNDAAKTVLHCMQACSDEAEAQSAVCALLALWACEPSGAAAAYLRSQRAMHAVLAALQAQEKDVSVQQPAISALGVLGRGDGAKAAFTSGYGLVEAIVGSMRSWIDDRGVQRHGCGSLWLLSSTAAGAHAIVEVGGAPAVVTALITYASDERVAQLGCAALLALCEHPSVVNAVADSASVEALSAAVANFPRNADLQLHAKTALSLLSACPSVCLTQSSPRRYPHARSTLSRAAALYDAASIELLPVWVPTQCMPF